MKKMDDMQRLEMKLNNIIILVIISFIILGSLILGLYFKTDNNRSDNNSGTTNTKTDTSNLTEAQKSYLNTVASMNEVSGKEAQALFETKGLQVLYIGRPGCGICLEMAPIFKQIQDEQGYKTNYLELGDNFRTEFGSLFDKFTKKVTINGEEGTIGELLYKYGYTPIFIIIKDGKFVDGFIGANSYDNTVALVKKYK